ncbi:MAG: hypothetical protein NDJ19_08360, partial [Ramlibacter sp.]|nr:hypothetical protein [Ramlibacter sp.]
MNKNRIGWTRAWIFACLFFAAAWPLALRAQTVVEAVSSSMQGGAEVVRIDFSQPLTAIPPGFAIQAPARIV